MKLESIRELIRRWSLGRIMRRKVREIPRLRLRLEQLEVRLVPTIYTVTNTSDSGAGSLRAAMISADSSNGNTIDFNIPTSDGGYSGGIWTITPLSPLPGLHVSNNTTINGYSQPGASVNTLSIGDNANLVIQLSGGSAGAGADGLSISDVSGCTIEGLVINGFSGTAISIYGSSAGSNLVSGNFIGTNASGTASLGNGIGFTTDSPTTGGGDTIGGAAPAARNIISGNSGDGVDLLSGTPYNVVEGNYIGTNAAGTAALGNGGIGVYVDSSNNVIGGASAGAGNVISGNFQDGVTLYGGGNTVEGNFIGTSADGLHALGNAGTGVDIIGSEDNQIGTAGNDGSTADAAEANVITANMSGNVLIDGNNNSSPGYNIVGGNFIGTDKTGNAALPGFGDSNGVLVDNVAENNFIGYNPSASFSSSIPNVISGNSGHGLQFDGNGTYDNLVIGNFVGTGAGGSGTLLNGGGALDITNTASVQAGGSFTGNVYVDYNSTLDLNGNKVSIIGALTGSGIVDNEGGSTGTLTLNGNTRFAGVLQDGTSPTALTLAGGTLNLSGDNFFTGGVTIDAGTLTLGNAGALNSSTPNVVSFGPSSTGDLQLNGYSITVAGLNTNATVGTPIIENASSTAATLTVNDTGSNTYGGVLQDGSGGGFLTLDKTGAGIQFLSGTNSSYRGETIFAGGILNVASVANYGVNSSLGARQASDENNSGTGIGLHFEGGTLQYTGSTPQSTNREIRFATGSGATIDASGTTPSATIGFTHTGNNTNLFDTPGTRTLTLTGTNTGNNRFSITLNDQGTNGTSLLKTGTGTWVYGGSADGTVYTGSSDGNNRGSTTVNAGTLVMTGNNPNRLAGTQGTTTVNNGGTLQLQANAVNISGGVSYVLSAETTANQPLILNNGATLQLRSDSNVAFAGANNYGGLGNATVTIDVNQVTAGNTNHTLTLASGGFNTGTTVLNVTGGNGFTLALGAVLTANNSALTLTANTANLSIPSITNVNGLTVGGAANTTISGAISGTSLTKSGSGTLTLGGTNTYTGGTTITGGVLSVGTDANLGTAPGSASANITINGGTLQATNSFTLNSNRGILLGPTSGSGSGTIDVTGSNTLIFSGTLNNNGSGTGALNLVDTGTFTIDYSSIRPLTAAYSGGTNVSGGGTLKLKDTSVHNYNNSFIGTGLLTVTNAVVDAQTTNPFGESNLNVTLNAGGVLTIDNGYTANVGAIILNGGTLTSGANPDPNWGSWSLDQDVTVDVGTSTISATAVNWGGSRIFTVNGTLDFTGTLAAGTNVSSNYALTEAGSGTMILTGSNTYTGTTTISGGTLQVGAGGTTGTLGSGNVTDNAALTFDLSSNVSVSDAISGSGTLTQAGGGTTTLWGANTYSGGTTASAGTLIAEVAGALGTGTVSLNGGTVTDVGGATTVAGFGVTGNGWTTNGGATISGDSASLVDGNHYEARSVFDDTPVATSGNFTAGFTYSPPGYPAGDGVTFVLQSSNAGAAGVGGNGGGLGYSGIGNSLAVALNIFTGSQVGTALYTNGNVTGSYQSVSPVNLTSGDPINITLTYNSTAETLTEVLTDLTANTTDTVTYTGVNLSSLVGSSAYVGFTGGDGAATGPQQINNFTFTASAGSAPVTAAAVEGFNTIGTDWSANGSASISSNVATLTDNNPYEASSVFYNNQVVTSDPFTANFTYTPSDSLHADGAAFVLQSSSAGAAALGTIGGGLGYAGIGNSLAVALNIYNGYQIGTALYTNGNVTGAYQSVSPVNLSGGDPINITLTYNPSTQTLTEVLTDPTAGTADTVTYSSVNLSSLVGNSAYVGFTGGDGQYTSTQQISNFSFTATPVAYMNDVAVTTGTTSTLNVTTNAGTVTFGALTVGDGATLNVAATSDPLSNQPYSVAFGATTLSGIGTLNVADNGNGVGTVVLGSVSDGISAGSLVTGGAGTVVLTGTDTYTGSTDVAAGTLQLAAVYVPDNSFESPSVGDHEYNPTGGSWTFSGSSPNGSGIAANGSAFNNANAPDGTQVAFLQGTGDFSQNINFPADGTYDINFLSAYRNAYSGANDFEVLVDGISYGTFTPTTSGSYLSYATSAFTVTAGSHTVEFQGLDDDGVGDFTSFVDDMAIIPAAPLNILPTTTNVTVAARATLDLEGNNQAIGALTGSGTITNSAPGGTATLTVNGSGTFDGVIQDGASAYLAFAVDGGTVTLTGTNTYSGGTAITGGTLSVSSDANLGTAPGSSAANLVIDGGTLEATNSFTLDSNRGILLGPTSGSGSGTIDVTGSNTLTFSGTLNDNGGTGALNLVDTGTFTIDYSGDRPTAPAYSGGTNVSGGGTLNLKDTNNNSDYSFLGTGPLTVTNATVDVQATNPLGITAPNQPAITLEAGGTLTIDDGYTANVGAIILNGGTLTSGANPDPSWGSWSLDQDVTVDAGTSTISATAVNWGGTRIFTVNSTLDFTGTLAAGTNVSSNFALTMAGAGTMILSGTNTYTGGTTISGGTLQVGAGGTTGSLGSGSVTDNAALAFDLSSNVTIANGISGSGGLTTQGSGTLTLTAANTYTGSTTVNAGTLQIGIANAIGSGSAVSLANVAGGTLDLNNFSDTIFSLSGGGSTGGNVTLGSGTLITGGTNATTSFGGNISGSGGLTKQGSGAFTVGGSVNITGTVTVNAGTLNLSGSVSQYSGGTLAGGTWIVNGATLNFPGGDTITTIGSGISVTLNGSAADFTSLSSLTANDGSFTLLSGANFTTSATNLANAGTLSISSSSSMLAGPANNFTYTQTAGSTALGGGTLDPTTINLTGGTLSGPGTLEANVNNTGGTVYPGGVGGTGILIITGNYTQASGGTLSVDIGGTTAGTQYDQLGVFGTATLAGTLDVPLVNGFTPLPENTFAIVTSVSASGTFGTTTGVSPYFSAVYNSTNVTLQVVTEYVTTTSDSGAGSLRKAIIDANNGLTSVAILFAIPAGDPGYQASTGSYLLQPHSALPAITNAVVIDGTSESGYAGTPMIVLDGTDASSSASGLALDAAGSTVRGLVIDDFGHDGIRVQANGDTIAGDFIGIDVTATTAKANGTGIFISSSNNTIGGIASTERNIISGNSGDGVDIDGGTTTNNAVRGNDIYGNGGLALDLSNGASTFSPSPLGSDKPTLTSLVSSPTTTIVVGSLSTTPSTTFEIDFLANPAGSTAPFQGQTYLGSLTAETDSTGAAAFNASLPTGSAPGDVFTYLITVPGDNTSPFAQVSPASSSTDVPPVVTVGGPAAAIVGLPVVFISNVTDTQLNRTFTYAWNVTNSTGTFTLPAGVVTDEPFLVFTPPAIGNYTIGLTVIDSRGDTDSSSWSLSVTDSNSGAASQSISLPVSGPTALILGNPTTVAVGTAVTLSGSLGSATLSGPLTYTWTLTPPTGVVAPVLDTSHLGFLEFTPVVAGSYQVSLTVTDALGDSAPATTVTIQAVRTPVSVTITGDPVASTAGAPITLSQNGTFTEDQPATMNVQLASTSTSTGIGFSWSITGQTVSYSELGTGSVSSSSPSYTISFQQPYPAGLYLVNVTLTSGSSTPFSIQHFIQVAGVTIVPTINGVPSTVVERSTVALTATTNAVNSSDVLGYQWTVTGPNRFTASGPGATFDVTPPSVGTYTVTLTVIGASGAPTATATFMATPARPKPIIQSTTTTSVTGTGSSAILTAFLTAAVPNVGPFDTLSYNWSVTDTTPNGVTTVLAGIGATNQNLTFAGPANDSFIISLTVTNDGDTVHAVTVQAPIYVALPGTPSVPNDLILTTDPMTLAGANQVVELVPSGANQVIAVAESYAKIDGSALSIPQVQMAAGGHDTLVGGSGDNVLQGDSGDNSLMGGSGPNTLYATSGDTLVGGAGTNSNLFQIMPGPGEVVQARNTDNTLSFSQSPTGVTVNLGITGSAQSVDNLNLGDSLSLIGTVPIQTLIGSSSGNDMLVAANNSTIYAGGGNDKLVGSSVSGVALFGGTGNDSLSSSGSDNITMQGGTGNTTLTSSGDTNITLFGGTGNDSLSSIGGTGVSMQGGTGNSTLTASGGTSITLFGGTGNDSLSSTGGDSITMIGGSGNTTLSASGGTSITLFGGTGNDSLSSTGADNVTIQGGTGNATLSASSGGPGGVTGGTSITLFGGTGNDSLSSTGGDTVTVVGGTGNSTLTSSGGTSITLFGGTGNDSLSSTGGTAVSMQGGTGNSTLSASSGGTSITLFGGTGNDSLSSTGGTGVSMVGGTGNSTLASSGGTSITLFGGTGNDSLSSTGGTGVSMQGGTGNTTLASSGGTSITLFGGTGNDSLSSTGGTAVSMQGGTGNSTLSASSGGTSITLFGGTGNDSLSSTGGTGVSMVGGTGNSTLTSSGGTSITLFGGTGNDSLSSTGGTGVSLVGGTGNSTLTASGGTSITLFGGTGNDSLSSTGGDSVTLVGGTGNSTLTSSGGTSITLFGGTGNDSLSSTNGATVSMQGGTGNSTLIASGGTSITLFGGTGNDSLSSTGGDSITMVGGTGNSTLVASGGTSITLFGGTGNDSISSSNDADLLMVGGSGTDTLQSTQDSNGTVLGGGAANDTISETNDTGVTLVGGAGNDTLSAVGGSGIVLAGLDGNNTYQITGTNADPISVSLNDLNAFGTAFAQDDSLTPAINTIRFPGLAGIQPGEPGITLDLSNSSSGTVVTAAEQQQVAPGITVSLTGAFQNVVGTPGNDWIKAGAGTSVLDGGCSGNDTLIGGSGPTTLVAGAGNDSLVAGSGGTTFRFAGSQFGSDTIDPPAGSGVNLLDFSKFSGPVSINLASTTPQVLSSSTASLSLTLQSAIAINAVADSAHDDRITDNSAGDTFYLGAGNDTITGGGGKDTFVSGSQLGNDTINETSSGNTLNFSGFGQGINLSLGQADAGTPQRLTGGANSPTLTLSDTSDFSSIIGTPYPDTIVGNNANDTIIGGGGADSLVAGSGNDYIQGDATQVVWLDFPSAADTTPGSHVYTPAEELAVLQGLQQIYSGFEVAGLNGSTAAGYYFTLDKANAQQMARAMAGQYATLEFDGNVVGGAASQLNTDNTDLGGSALINVSGFLAPTMVSSDFGSFAGLVSPTSANVIGLTTTIAAHELGHLSGLQHQDALGPIGSGIFLGVNPEAFYPALPGVTTTTLSAAYSSDGTLIDYTATVAPDASGGGAPTGTVEFLDATTGLELANSMPAMSIVVAGTSSSTAHDASVSIPASLGGDTIVATYSGDSTYSGSSASQTIGATASTIELISGPTPIGENLLLQAVVSAAGGSLAPTGTVEFIDATTGAVLATVPLTGLSVKSGNGTVMEQVATSAPIDASSLANHQIVALYSGDGNFVASSASQILGVGNANDGSDTPLDVMASPDAVGNTLADAAGELGQTYLGERDLIALAFNDTGTILQQSNLATTPIDSSIVRAFEIPQQDSAAYEIGDLPSLAVPNTLPAGVVGAGSTFNVSAVAVNGELATPSEENFYAFNGQQGQVMSFQIIANTNTLNTDPVLDPELIVIGPNGEVIGLNVHEFESADSTILDVTLPSSGNYYVGVDSYESLSAGNYQLFMYSFASAPDPSSGDTLVGGSGNDMLVGSSGNDTFSFLNGSAGNATILGGSGQDTVDQSFAPQEKIVTTGSITVLSAPTIAYGQDGLVSVTMTNSLGNPLTGTVNLSVNGGQAIPDTLEDGSYTFDLGVLEAGTYSLSVNYAAQGNNAARSARGTLTIYPDSTPTVMVSDAGGTYNGQTFPATATVQSVNGSAGSSLEGVSLTLTYYAGSTAGGTALSGAPSNAGTYTVVASFAGSTHFVSASAQQTFTITPATLTILASSDSRTYDGNTDDAAMPTYQVANEPANTLYGLDTLSDLTQAFESRNVLGTDASTLMVTAYTVNDGDNGADYTVTLQTAAGSITPAPLTITADDKSKVYGQADPTLTYTITGMFYNGDSPSLISGVMLSTDTGAAATAGQHVITASGGTAVNYAITDANGTLTVSQATLTVTADNQSKIYGATDPTLTYTPSGTLYYGDGYSVITGVSLSTTTGAAATAGTQTITATSGTAANYAITDVSGTLTVSQAALTVTADSQSKVYGGADPTLTYTPSGTLYYGDGYSVITGVSLSTTTGAAATAGTHTITATGGTAANYAITDVNGTLTVSQAALIVTADNQSKTYGATDPTLTYTPSGTLYYGDSYSVITGVSLSTTTGAAATAGTHTITASGGMAANYAVTDVNGTLSVSQAALTVTADSQSKIYGAADPTLTYTPSGMLYYSDTYSVITGVSLSTTTDVAATAGTHTITATGGTAANYAITDVNGTLTVSQAALTVTADNQTKVYGAADPTLTYTPSGTLYYGDAYAVITGVSLSMATGAAATAGTHTIAATGGTAANYAVTDVNGTLTVSKAALTVTANNATRVYGANNPTFTDAITGFVYADTLSVVSGFASITTSAGTTSAPGTYTLTAALGTLSANNYTFGFVNGTLTINPDATTIATSATVSGQNATFSATVSANAPGSGTPSGSVTFVDTTTSQTLGTVPLTSGSASLTTNALPTGSQTITATYSSDTDFLASTGTVTIAPAASIYVLNPTSSGALTISGNADIDVPGTVDVDSNSSKALIVSSNAIVTATGIQIVGGYSASGNAHLNPKPTTGTAAVADPLGALPYPSLSGTKSTENLGGNSSATINSGIYSSITVSGNASLTMNPGIYVITGGGFSVSGNGSVSAAGVLIYNAGSNYPSPGGSFGGITLSGNGKIALSAATTGTYAGLGIFQSRDNTQPLSLSGNNITGITGSIYAANAQLTLSGNAQLKDALVVGTLNLSGNAVFNTLTSGGSDGSGGDGSGDNSGGGDGSGNTNAGPASAVVFAAGPTMLTAGQSSALITMQLQDSNGNVAGAGTGGVTLTLDSTSSTGRFLDFDGDPTSTLTIDPGESTVSFIYEDSTVGIPTLSVTGPGFSAARQEIVTGAPAAVIFTNTPQTMTSGQSSQTLTLQLEDETGNMTQAGTNGVKFSLTTTSNDGVFLDTAGNAISTITIAPGTSTASFIYEDGAIGMPTLTATAAGFSATQQETVNAGSVVYTPSQIRGAYGINDLPLDGSGQTIAVVDAYDNPVIFQAADIFDQQLGLTASGATLYQQYGPASSFLTVVNQDGQAAPLPATDPSGPGTDNWEAEEALDVEWTHAVAPGAHIILVEARSQSLADLMAAVATAAAQPGVSVVSMSWGFSESQANFASDEATYDPYLTTPAGHQGVTFVASTGDYGSALPEYPAFSPNVVAVGGTSLSLNADGTYNSESGWGYYANALGTFIGSGGGVSQYEAEPGFQQGVQSTGARTVPDVSFVADPATGAWIADPYNISGANPWEIAGGTSLSAPAWAGLIALVDQGRVLQQESTLGTAGPTEAQLALYNLPQSDYNVITSGSNGEFTAQAGYNLVTGLGTPVADQLVPDLIAWSGTLNTSGSTVPAWQGSSSYQGGSGNDGSSGGTDSALVINIFAFQSVGMGRTSHSLASYEATGASTPAPVANAPQSTATAAPAASLSRVPGERGYTETASSHTPESTSTSGRFDAVMATLVESAPTVAWTGGPFVSGPATQSSQALSSPSIFSQTGPLVLDRWGENPLVRIDRVHESGDPQTDPLGATTPGLDNGVLVGGAGNDLVIGGGGRNLMVGGFGFDRSMEHRAETRMDSPSVATDSDVSSCADTAASLRIDTMSSDTNDALWTSLTGRSADAASADALDQLFGSAGLDLTNSLGDEES